MSKNYLTNGDFGTGSFEGWQVNEDYIKLINTTQEVEGKHLNYFAGISPSPVSVGAVFQQVGVIDPGTYELSFAHGAGIAGEQNPERFCVGGLTYVTADGLINGIAFDFVAKASLRYERLRVVIPARAQPIRMAFGVNVLGFQDSARKPTVGPIVVGDFELVRVSD